MSSVSFIEHILLELFGYTENDDKYINKRIGFSYIKPRIFDQTMRVYKVMCSEEKILLAIRASCIKRRFFIDLSRFTTLQAHTE